MDFIDMNFIRSILNNSLYSLTRVLVGTLIAMVVGISFGVLRSCLPSRLKRNRIFKFVVDFMKFPPPIAWIPLVILFFGIGEVSAVTIVFIGAFAPIFANTYEGAESVPEVIKNTANSFEIKGIRYILRILIPYSASYIFTGIRVGIGMGWMSVIAAEMVSGHGGLGHSIQLNRFNLQHRFVLLDIFVIGIIGFLLHEIVLLLERKIIPWHIRSQRQEKGA